MLADKPDRDDQRGAVVVSEQQREVLGVKRAGEGHRAGAEVLHALQPGRVAVAEGRHHHVGAAGQRLGRHLGGVADDEVEAVPAAEQGVRAGRRSRPAPAGTPPM